MTSSRRTHRRPYSYELLALANLAAIFLLTVRANPLVLVTIPETFGSFVKTLLGYTVAGVIIRAVVAAFRGELRSYLRVVRSAGWLTDTLRLLVFGGVMAHAYFWIKLLVPLLHPRLFDQQLWDLDQAIFFGFSPNILFLEVFSHPPVLRFIDWSYARIFFASVSLAFVFFLSSPSRRLRIAFNTGNNIMWTIGAWGYLLIPSLGPAFRFPEIWIPLASALPITQQMQAFLMQNYQEVLRLPLGTAKDVQLMFGVAAFPSLHVAFQTFAFLWMRRIWIYGQIVFGVFTLIILIGSVVTGWHYLIDSLAGMVMAAFAYWAASRLWRIRRWRRLRQIVVR